MSKCDTLPLGKCLSRVVHTEQIPGCSSPTREACAVPAHSNVNPEIRITLKSKSISFNGFHFWIFAWIKALKDTRFAEVQLGFPSKVFSMIFNRKFDLWAIFTLQLVKFCQSEIKVINLSYRDSPQKLLIWDKF